MHDLRIWEPLAVKQQVYKTAVEVRREERVRGVCCVCFLC